MAEENRATTLTAPQAGPRMIKMKAILPVAYNAQGDMAKPGDVFETTEELAKDFEKVFEGGYSVSGENGAEWAESQRFKYKRAARVS